MLSYRRLSLTVWLIVLLTGCAFPANPQPVATRPAATNTALVLAPTNTVATASPENPPATVEVASPAPNESASATTVPTGSPTEVVETPVAADATPPATAVTPNSPLPAPTLFEVAWDDRTPFAAGLVSAEQGALDNFPAASVYHLDLTIAPDYRRMTGREEIYLTNNEGEPLTELVLRLYPNLLGGRSVVSDVQVNGEAVAPVLELDDTVLRVPLATALEAGQSLVLSLSLDVTIPDSAEGNYGSFVFAQNVLALAHAYPILAAYDENGWDAEIPAESGDLIYADSSFYLTRITAPAATTLIASGVRIDETTEGDTQTVTFAAGPVRDFYMVMSENFEVASATVGETTVNSYVYSEHAGANAEALANAADSLEIFNTLIGGYPFTKLDMVETPNLALGIEYPTVIVITDRLYAPDAPNFGAPQNVVRESTIAHEVGHQWFYSTVGNDQLDEPWLDESLVQYITYRYFLEQYGPDGAGGFRGSFEGRWSNSNGQEIPIGLPVGDYTPQEYSSIIYGRGPIFFIELEETIGTEAFDSFLQSYYQENKFGISTTEIIKGELEQSCSCDLTPLFEEWVYE